MKTNRKVRLALPSKGRMENETLAFLTGCGLPVNKINPRQYTADLPAIPEIEILFQRPRDIPKSIANGDIDLGITGYDTVYETVNGNYEDLVLIHEKLGYGTCSLVIAVPTEWTNVNDIEGLRYHAYQSGGLRLATKYENSARLFIEKHQLNSEIQIIEADGALEAAPSIGYADFICDITSSGTTLRENKLKMLSDGVIIESEAVWIGNRSALQESEAVLTTTSQMLEFIEAHLSAQGQYLVFANIRGQSEKEVSNRAFSQPDLGGLQGPTIAPILTPSGNGGWWAINLVVDADKLYEVIHQIRSIGGSGVIASPITYIFNESPARFQRLLAELGKEEISL